MKDAKYILKLTPRGAAPLVGKVLASAAPYTEPVQTGNLTLYRARFAGFSSKEAARAACAYLATQKFSCLAISN